MVRSSYAGYTRGISEIMYMMSGHPVWLTVSSGFVYHLKGKFKCIRMVCAKRISKLLVHDSTCFLIIRVSILETVRFHERLLCSVAVCSMRQLYILIKKRGLLFFKCKKRKLNRARFQILHK